MSKYLPSSLTCIVLCLATNPTQAAGDAEWFAAFKASFGEVVMTNISNNGTIGTGEPFGDDVDGRIIDDQVDDYSAGLGFSFGRRMGYWTLEGEFVWHYRTDWDIGAATYSIGTVTNVFSNVESRSLLVNLIRRGPISPYWSWEVGAGIGLVKHKVESEYLERPIPGIRPQQSFKASSSESGFGYNVLAGITRDLGGAWTLNMRYRFIDLGEMQAGPFPMRPAKVTTDATAQEIQFSLEREF